MINQEYKERVRLLLRIIPIISTEECFAVHGGTAINLFVQNLPRYSVDIDLTYIPVEPRGASLAHIKERLKEIKAKIEATIPGIAVREVPNKLICTHNGHFVKVEVNDVKRGIIAPPIELPLCDLAQEDFGVFCKARIVPLSQLYGGKITAALDRQHPRDLFDVSLMLDYIKDFDQIKRGFIFCLLGSDRPILESLNPNFNDQRDALTNQFEGMSSTPFTYEQYEATRHRPSDTDRQGIFTRIRRRDAGLGRIGIPGLPALSVGAMETVQYTEIKVSQSKETRGWIEEIENVLFRFINLRLPCIPRLLNTMISYKNSRRKQTLFNFIRRVVESIVPHVGINSFLIYETTSPTWLTAKNAIRNSRY